MTATTPCPDFARWEDFLDGDLPADERARLGAHLDDCEDCQQTLEGLTASDADWAAAARGLEEPTEPDPLLRGAMDELKGEGQSADVCQDQPLSFLAPPEKP